MGKLSEELKNMRGTNTKTRNTNNKYKNCSDEVQEILNKKEKKDAWKDKYYLDSYLMAKDGKSNNQIAKLLGVPTNMYKKWILKKKYLRSALKEGRKDQGASGSKQFLDYVYGCLPANLKPIWEEIEQSEEGFTKSERVEGLIMKGGVRAKQHLFLHALVCSDFNPSEACRRIGITKTELDKWRRESKFSQIMEEFHEHKKNFFEGSLIRLVKRGDASAVIFANRTINRDRGYNERTDVNVSVTNTLINIEDLNLPLDIRKVILEAINKKEEQETKLLEDKSNIIEAEYTVNNIENNSSREML